MDKEIEIKKKKRKLSIYYGLLITVICIIGVSYNFYKHILDGYIDKRIENGIYKDIMHILAICKYLWPGIGCGKP